MTPSRETQVKSLTRQDEPQDVLLVKKTGVRAYSTQKKTGVHVVVHHHSVCDLVHFRGYVGELFTLNTRHSLSSRTSSPRTHETTS